MDNPGYRPLLPHCRAPMPLGDLNSSKTLRMLLNEQTMVGANTLLLRIISGDHPHCYKKMLLARTYIFDDACK